MHNIPQLFCFTYAGGNASFFDVIEQDLGHLNMVTFEYAGHGTRYKEPFYDSFYELADDIYQQLMYHYAGGRYGLFGYSMGSITLVEILKRIIGDGKELPANVFLAAHEPYTKSELFGFTPDELDEWVMKRTIEFGAVPEKLLNNKPFWRTYLPIYCADYSIIGKYDFEGLNLKTEVPATVFYSEMDTPFKEMKLWKKYFVGECDFYQYTGTHFFIREHHNEMAEIITQKMKLTNMENMDDI